MEFVHKSYEKGKTIAAIATPPGDGGISIIRISGDFALDIANKVFSKDVKSFATHTAHLGSIISERGEKIDSALCLVMIGPNSFTGEHTVEMQCHGGKLVTQAALNAIFAAGAEPALPGEFSYKAFINGKIDLTKAEAIQELIAAKNERALKSAKRHLDGALHNEIVKLQKKLVEIAAIFEAWVDYPEEGLEFASYDDILEDLQKIEGIMKLLHASYHEGKILKDGLRLCMLGAPNAGKSSLLNALSKKERAIVTDIAGTTRDVIEEELLIGNLSVILSDTAGIRNTGEAIEQEGIKRSFSASEDADLILYLIDANIGATKDDLSLLEKLDKEKTLVVWNKCDIHAPVNSIHYPHEVQISAKTKMNLDLLVKEIEKICSLEKLEEHKESVTLTSERHYKALMQAKTCVYAASDGLKKDLSPELLCIEIKEALKHLGTIIGFNITEDILSSIFSKFCVGK
ncbi:MAG: tRNA modification GTPase MnmE [Chlamydiia bacterium]|nr:tRNA modification GTPase MnmE [Chlamydiia bacterium]